MENAPEQSVVVVEIPTEMPEEVAVEENQNKKYWGAARNAASAALRGIAGVTVLGLCAAAPIGVAYDLADISKTELVNSCGNDNVLNWLTMLSYLTPISYVQMTMALQTPSRVVSLVKHFSWDGKYMTKPVTTCSGSGYLLNSAISNLMMSCLYFLILYMWPYGSYDCIGKLTHTVDTMRVFISFSAGLIAIIGLGCIWTWTWNRYFPT